MTATSKTRNFKSLLAASLLISSALNLGYYHTASAALSNQYHPVEVGLNGQSPNDYAGPSSISSDGRYVAYQSPASNLVAADNNGHMDAFRYDRTTGTTILISGDSSHQSNGETAGLAFSRDGQYAAFFTQANNLGGSPVAGSWSLYLHDIALNSNTLVVTGFEYANYASVSSDGRLVTYVDSKYNIQLFNATNGVTTPITTDSSALNAQPYAALHYTEAKISADGSKVLYTRQRQNGDDQILYDVVTGERYNATTNGGGYGSYDGSSISDNGRYVTFSANGNYHDSIPNKVFIYDTITRTIKTVTNGLQYPRYYQTAVSNDGTRIAVELSDSESEVHKIAYLDNAGSVITQLCGDSADICVLPYNGQGLSGDGSVVDLEHYTVGIGSDYTPYTYDVSPAAPSAPTGLAVPSSPTRVPQLSWSSVAAATGYNIYRDGSLLASVSSVTYLDMTANSGNHTYYVTALSGSIQSVPSNSISVFVDKTPPIVTVTPDRAPNAASWYKAPVTITWGATDPAPSSGVPTTPAATIANLEGTKTYTSGQSCDPAGNCATGSLQLSIDTLQPSGMYTGNAVILRLLGQKVTGMAADVTSGVASVSITSNLGNITLNSGAGGAISLACNSTKTSCTYSANANTLLPGLQTLTLKVTDVAGNVYTTSKLHLVL